MVKLKDKFRKTADLSPQKGVKKVEKGPEVPKGLWIKCPKCGELLYKEDVVENSYVCPKCSGYFRMKAKTRIRMMADPGTFQAWDEDVVGENPLSYPGYEEKREEIREKSRLSEAVMLGSCTIGGQKTVLGVCDSQFFMGSMGYAVGERIVRAFERAEKEKLPVVLFCCSGGARMQEGIVSLMQMAKTSAAIKKHSAAGLLPANSHGSHHGRCDGQLCHAGGCDSGGTGSADWFCRASRDCADDWPEASGRLPESRISGGKGNA